MKVIFYKFFCYTAASLAAFFLPITWALTSIIAVVVIDTITGVMKAGKSDVDKVQSKRLGAIITKLIFYFSGVVLGRICELFIDDQIPFVKLVLVAVMLIEVKSIDENFKAIYGYSFVDKVLKAFKKISRK